MKDSEGVTSSAHVAAGEDPTPLSVLPATFESDSPPESDVPVVTSDTEEAVSRARQVGKTLWKLGGVLLALAISVAVYLVRDRLQEVARYGYLGLFLISVLGNATIILPMPTLVTTFIGGGVFHPVLVGVISAAGATIGELTGYLAGLSGKAVIENQELYDRFNVWMEKYGLLALFLLAAFPNPFFDLAGIIAGISHMRVTTYLLVVWAGKIVKFVIVAYLGAGSAQLLDFLRIR